MGLDNGIKFSARDKELLKSTVKYGNYESAPTDYMPEVCQGKAYEICYFRKFYGVRDEVMAYLRAVYPEKDRNDCYWKLSQQNLLDIKEIFEKWIVDILTGQNDVSASSIWENEIEVAQLADAAKEIYFFLQDVDEAYNEYEVFFYDSY